MVKKKSTKKSTNKTVNKAETFDVKALVVALGVVVAGLAVVILWLAGQRVSDAESQKLKAFDGVVGAYIDKMFFVDGEQTGIVNGTGVTDDGDLYVDFTVTKYENHVPMRSQKARLHFQCNDETNQDGGCAQAFWYGDWVETSENFRSAYRDYINETETLVDKYNAAETDEERATIRQEHQALYDKYKDVIEP